MVIGRGLRGADGGARTGAERVRRRGARRPRPGRRTLLHDDAGRCAGRPRRHVRRPDPGRGPRAGRRTRLPDRADLQRRQEPDPLARPGAVLSQHHPEAVDRSNCSTSSRIQWRFERIAARCRRRRAVDGPRRREAGRQVAGRLAALGRTRRRPPRGPDGDHGAGDVGLRTRRGVDAARGALRQGRGRHRTGCSTSRAARSRTASPAAPSRSPTGWPTELGERVRLDAAVSRIEWSDDAVAVTVDGRGGRRAAAPSSAIPPAHRAAIDIRPGPADRVRSSWPSTGRRARSARPTPPTDAVLARPPGTPVEALSDEGPVFITFDVSPGDDGPGVLLGFTDCAHLRRAATRGAPREARSTASPRCSASGRREPGRLPRPLLGRRVVRARRADGRGAAGIVDARTGRCCARRSDGIFWAGTETADEWTGFLDGAVRSGRRAAAEVAGTALRS